MKKWEIPHILTGFFYPCYLKNRNAIIRVGKCDHNLIIYYTFHLNTNRIPKKMLFWTHIKSNKSAMWSKIENVKANRKMRFDVKKFHIELKKDFFIAVFVIFPFFLSAFCVFSQSAQQRNNNNSMSGWMNEKKKSWQIYWHNDSYTFRL